MRKPGVVPCVLLLALAPGCGAGKDDTAKNGNGSPCFTVTPDASAIAAGAIAGKQTQCIGSTNYQPQTDALARTTTVVILGEGGGRPSPGWATNVDLELTYVVSDVVPATFHASDPCPSGRPAVTVSLGYDAYDPSDGINAEWSCTTCMDQSATFDLSITSVEGDVATDSASNPQSTIHGTLHAVCGPNTAPPLETKAGAGNVTIDGPF